jgi:outer membrane protein assembly factor BamB
MFRADARRTGAVTARGPMGRPRLRWHVPGLRWVLSSPAVVGQTVYVPGSDGNLYALDLASGVYVAGGDGNLYAFQLATGRLQWRRHVGVAGLVLEASRRWRTVC